MARAMWKAALRVGRTKIAIKLYAAAREAGVHFRLVHAKDGMPVRQRWIDAVTGEEVAPADLRRAVAVDDRFVVLQPEEWETPDPNEDKVIEVTRFVPSSAIDVAWYARPYYLDPDGSEKDFFAFAYALAEEGRVGLVSWTMRRTPYHGALRERDGHLELVALHAPEEVVPIAALEVPNGASLSVSERKLAEQLVSTLDAPFRPETLVDEYRERVLELVARKRKGERYAVRETRAPSRTTDLATALRKSLARAKAGRRSKDEEEREVA